MSCTPNIFDISIKLTPMYSPPSLPSRELNSKTKVTSLELAKLIRLVIYFQEVQANHQHDLDSISNWLAVNKLSLNVAKTKCAVFNTRYFMGPRDLMLQVDDVGLEQVATYKYLGIHLGENLNFSDHIDFVVNKSRCKLGMLKRFRK